MTNAPSTSALDGSPTVCLHCQTTNQPSRRYCGNCGQRLWEPCGQCRTPNSVDLAFCGHCGTSLKEDFERRAQALRQLLTHAEQRRQDGYYLEAIRHLEQFEVLDDTRLSSLYQTLRERRIVYEQERANRIVAMGRQFALAQQLFGQHDFYQAQQVLDQIPVGLRDPLAQQLWVDCSSRLREVDALLCEVKERLARRDFDGLLPKVRALLQFRPGDEKLAAVADKLARREHQANVQAARQAIVAAKQLFLAGQYAAAEQVAANLPMEHLPAEARTTYETLREVGFLDRQLNRAAFALSHHDCLFNRWAKLRPQESRVSQLRDEYQRHLRADGAPLSTPWHRQTLPDSRLGLSVERWQGCGDSATSSQFPALVRHGSSFHVAYGLALQAIGAAALPLNLLPESPHRLRRRWTAFGKSAPPPEAWGVDVGTSALKCVKLKRAPTQASPEVVDIQRIDHAVPLSATEHQTAANEIIQQSLRTFSSNLPAGRHDVAVGFSGPKTLGRWFDIPRMEAKKMADAVAYEAKLQVPIPIEDIHYDWHVLSAPDDATTAFQNVVLVAARRDQIAQHLKLFDELPLRIVALQSVCVALYNAALATWPFAATANDADDATSHDSADEAAPYGILDLGVESSNLVVVSPHRVRFRSLPIGTARLDRELMRELRLTRSQAQEVRLQPQRARWLYQVDQHTRDVYDELVNDLARSLHAFESEGLKLTKLIATGGAVEQLGVLDCLIHAGSYCLRRG